MSDFAFADVDVPKTRAKRTKATLCVADIPDEIEAGLALMLGRNSEGKIKVFARNDCSPAYVQVGLFDRYELALEHVRQLKADSKFRRTEIREAKKLKDFKE